MRQFTHNFFRWSFFAGVFIDLTLQNREKCDNDASIKPSTLIPPNGIATAKVIELNTRFIYAADFDLFGLLLAACSNVAIQMNFLFLIKAQRTPNQTTPKTESQNARFQRLNMVNLHHFYMVI